MKFRNGFVSNSSSSSYVCCDCGEIESGWDLILEDTYFYSCENGHILCRSHFEEYIKKTKPRITEKISGCFRTKFEKLRPFSEGMRQYWDDVTFNFDDLKDFLDKYNIDPFLLPSEWCPICNLYSLSTEDRYNYLCKKHNINFKEIEKEVSSKFKNYKEFKEYINGN